MILDLGVVISIAIIIVCSISIVLAISFDISSDHGSNNAASALAVVSENRNDLLLTIKDSKYDYNSIAASKSSSVIDGIQIFPTIHPISFAEDTLFPQSFESNPSGSDIATTTI